MMAKGKGSQDLLDLVAETLKAEIAPALPPDKRYALAMAANAIEIAARDIRAADEAAETVLLDAFYEDGDGTLADLARDIRSGRISGRTHPELRKRLRANLVAELKVRNPRFLKSRGVKA